ncbi:MAG: hypothetical protein JST20_06135 [Bacteroidetes bacterium]|nr:hypothetical protein [Bacteroidota bacterium]
MQSLHSRLYPALISDFYRERLNKFGFNDIICPPYCCPNSFASVLMTAASCFLLSIEWDEGTPTNGGVQHHTIPISASNGIEFYVGQVPTGVTPYISVSNCDVTTCCTRTYKICEDVNVPGNPEDRIIEDEVQPPPPSPNTCVVSNNFTCFPRCNQ